MTCPLELARPWSWTFGLNRQGEPLPRKRSSPEQIIAPLREAEVLLAKGPSAGEAGRHLGTSQQTYSRWRKEYGDLD